MCPTISIHHMRADFRAMCAIEHRFCAVVFWSIFVVGGVLPFPPPPPPRARWGSVPTVPRTRKLTLVTVVGGTPLSLLLLPLVPVGGPFQQFREVDVYSPDVPGALIRYFNDRVTTRLAKVFHSWDEAGLLSSKAHGGWGVGHSLTACQTSCHLIFKRREVRARPFCLPDELSFDK